LLYRIIDKHRQNAIYNKDLYERYEVLQDAVPILTRTPRFPEDDDDATINNKVNNDFMGEIVDFKVGYFAGKAIGYSYNKTAESSEDTGGEEAMDDASKALTDFITRNNMYDVDMETTKYATICGYSGRLFYHDPDGNERCMPVAPYETIVLAETGDITEPTYSIRYYECMDINDNPFWHVEFYDDTQIRFYEGDLSALVLKETKANLYDMCPLQGIPNNKEMLGDAEKVLALIDAYDKAISDDSNEVESFSNAYMVFQNVNITDEEIGKARKSGAIRYRSPTDNGKVFFLTKDATGDMNEKHLDRLEDNIYRFSKTPNLSDEAFGTASGVALKFKLTGLETKCGMFQAKMMSAGTYMFRLLAESWGKKRITVDPLQCTMDFKRNFPLDILNEAQATQALINAGLPKQIAFSIGLSCIDDIDYVMQLIEEEQNGIPPLEGGDEEEEAAGGEGDGGTAGTGKQVNNNAGEAQP
jgi:SPP1 family phage portal protein